MARNNAGGGGGLEEQAARRGEDGVVGLGDGLDAGDIGRCGRRTFDQDAVFLTPGVRSAP